MDTPYNKISALLFVFLNIAAMDVSANVRDIEIITHTSEVTEHQIQKRIEAMFSREFYPDRISALGKVWPNIAVISKSDGRFVVHILPALEGEELSSITVSLDGLSLGEKIAILRSISKNDPAMALRLLREQKSGVFDFDRLGLITLHNKGGADVVEKLLEYVPGSVMEAVTKREVLGRDRDAHDFFIFLYKAYGKNVSEEFIAKLVGTYRVKTTFILSRLHNPQYGDGYLFNPSEIKEIEDMIFQYMGKQKALDMEAAYIKYMLNIYKNFDFTRQLKGFERKDEDNLDFARKLNRNFSVIRVLLKNYERLSEIDPDSTYLLKIEETENALLQLSNIGLGMIQDVDNESLNILSGYIKYLIASNQQDILKEVIELYERREARINDTDPNMFISQEYWKKWVWIGSSEYFEAAEEYFNNAQDKGSYYSFEEFSDMLAEKYHVALFNQNEYLVPQMTEGLNKEERQKLEREGDAQVVPGKNKITLKNTVEKKSHKSSMDTGIISDNSKEEMTAELEEMDKELTMPVAFIAIGIPILLIMLNVLFPFPRILRQIIKTVQRRLPGR